MKRSLFFLAALSLLLSLTLLPSKAQAASDGSYQQTNLVSDLSGQAMSTDTNVVNAWGLSHSENGPWWISDNGSGKSSIYNGSGVSVAPPVTIPPPTGASGRAAPTGNVFNKINATNPE